MAAAAALSHEDVILALAYAYPTSEWSYDGDGSSLDPLYEEDGETLISRGLEWHDDSQDPPTLAALQKGLAAAKTAAALVVVRRERDALLAACDWTQAADSPLDDATKASWVAYRQQLRDFPNQTGFDPFNPPAWPVPPA